MDKASELVSKALLGLDIKFVRIGGETYTIKSPSIKTILTATKYFSKLEINENQNEVEIIKDFEKNTPYITKGIAVFIVGKDNFKARRIAKKLFKGTYKELLNAIVVCVELMGGRDFFAIASLLKNMRKMVAVQK